MNKENSQNHSMMKVLRKDGVYLNWDAKGLRLLMPVPQSNGIKAQAFQSNLGILALVALSPIFGIKVAFISHFPHGGVIKPNPVKEWGGQNSDYFQLYTI